MTLHSSAALAATFSFGLVTFFPMEGDVTFAPKEGSEATKTFRERTELQLESAEMSMGDQEMPADQLGFEIVQGRSVEVTDTYGATANGAPTELRRKFGNVGATIEMDLSGPDGEPETADIEAEYELTGETVEFAVKDGETVVTFAKDSEDADEELLDGLVVDMDLCEMMRGSEGEAHEEGDRWNADPETFLALTRPGGVGFVPFEPADDEHTVGLFVTGLMSCRDAFANPDGDVELYWKGTRDIDGVRCAVLDLDVDLTGATDLTDLMLEDLRACLPELGDDAEFAQVCEATVSLDGEGELIWNLEANRLHTVEIELDNETIFDISGSVGDDGMEISVILTATGTSAFSVEVD